MKYLSLFSGIGGFELGIQQAYESLCNVNRGENGGSKGNQEGNKRQRFQSPQRQSTSTSKRSTSECSTNIFNQRPLCIGYSEIDKYAIQIYEKHFNHKNFGDITRIKEKELPDFDLLVGGFPCQSFSIAGKRGGFSDTRGTMFFEIARILKCKKPKLLLLGNVKGLLSHEEGRTFATIISTLDELGYDLQWQVLNSKNHGVPQNRERVFIIGHLRGTPRPEVFPFGENSERITERSEQTTVNTLTAGGHSGGMHSSMSLIQINQPIHSNDRIYSDLGISPTLNTMQGGNRQPKVAKTIRTGGRGSPHGSKQNWDSYEFSGNIRRLTPTECERLQGFPDGWTEEVSDTQRYKCLGNAVTVNVIQSIMSRLLQNGVQ